MKPLLSILAALSVYSIAVPARADPPPFMQNVALQPYPGERRIMSYTTNGTPVYAVYQIVGYDAMGYPIYQWVTQPVSYGYVRPYYGYNRGYRNYGYGNYGYRSYNYRPGYVRPTFVNPPHMHSNFGGHVNHFGSMGHMSGPVSHGGGHMSHGGGGHFSHGGGGHVSHGGGGHVSHGGGGHMGHGGGGHHR